MSTIEEFFQFGKKPLWYIKPDAWGEKLLRPTIHTPSKIIQVVNANSGKVGNPRATLEVPKYYKEALYCQRCKSYVGILRANAKITEELVLSSRYSAYLTKRLEYCQCKSMGVLVDNRGILRVYGEASKISLVSYLSNYPLHHQLDYQEHAEIDLRLLDGIKPRYERIIKPRYLWNSNTIDLSFLKQNESLIVLPVPISTWSLTNRKIDRVIREYHQSYAYNHKLLIITTNYLVLPNGILIRTEDPIVAKYLKEHKELRLPKRTHSLLEESNRQAEELAQLLIEAYNLPEVELREYPYQTIGYLQIIRNRPPRPIYHNKKIFISELEAREIRHMLNTSRLILREYLQKSKHALGQYINQLKVRNFSHTLPVSAFSLTQKLSYRTPPEISQRLYQYKTSFPVTP